MKVTEIVTQFAQPIVEANGCKLWDCEYVREGSERFLRLYIDIMRERFLDGFEIEIDLPSKVLSRKVVPCALQVLVENAFKHNSATPSRKLHIRIWNEKGKVVVQNNINHKQTPSVSNGFGLKNLRVQYSVLSGESIEVVEDGENFTVKIPLL